MYHLLRIVNTANEQRKDLGLMIPMLVVFNQWSIMGAIAMVAGDFLLWALGLKATTP